MNAREIVSAHEVWACSETSDARDVARMMAEHDIGAIPVLDSHGRLEGIVTDRDLCCKVLAMGRSADTAVREVMSRPVHTCYPDTSLHEVESAMRRYRIRRMPVVNDENRLQGFVSLSDLARHCQTPGEEHELVGVLEMVSAPS